MTLNLEQLFTETVEWVLSLICEWCDDALLDT
jgi:hypothetical protein